MKAATRVCALSILAALLPGCTATVKTPDGHTFLHGTREATVQSELGPPDLVSHWMSYGIDPWTADVYLDRGYVVSFRKGIIRHVDPIEEAWRPELERQARVFKEVIPLIKIGGAGADVLALLGRPDFVTETRDEQGYRVLVYRGPYADQLDRTPPPEQLGCFWKDRGVVVTLDHGNVREARPMGDEQWRGVFKEEPPAVDAKDRADS